MFREEEVAARKRKPNVWVTGESKKKRQEEGKVRGGIWSLEESRKREMAGRRKIERTQWRRKQMLKEE
jgi:hypothetical protein